MMLYTQLLNYLDPVMEIAVGHQTLSDQIFKIMKKKVFKGHNILWIEKKYFQHWKSDLLYLNNYYSCFKWWKILFDTS